MVFVPVLTIVHASKMIGLALLALLPYVSEGLQITLKYVLDMADVLISTLAPAMKTLLEKTVNSQYALLLLPFLLLFVAPMVHVLVLTTALVYLDTLEMTVL